MKRLIQLALLLCSIPALLLLTGCKDSSEPEESAEEEFEWDPSWGPAPEGMSSGSGSADGTGEAEVVRDTHYRVVEKRQTGGELVEAGEVSKFDGKPRMTRTPLESMIIVEGNMTGQRSAYLLPPGDYNTVQEEHRLQESTLSRWEPTSEDHIPPPAPSEEDGTLRSRTGGAAEQFAY